MSDLAKLAEITAFTIALVEAECEKHISEAKADLFKSLQREISAVKSNLQRSSLISESAGLKNEIDEVRFIACDVSEQSEKRLSELGKRLNLIIENTQTLLSRDISNLTDKHLSAERRITEALQQAGLNLSENISDLQKDVSLLSESFSERVEKLDSEGKNFYTSLTENLEKYVAKGESGLTALKEEIEQQRAAAESVFSTTVTLIKEELTSQSKALSEAKDSGENSLDVVSKSILEESIAHVNSLSTEFEEKLSSAAETFKTSLNESVSSSTQNAQNLIEHVRQNLQKTIADLQNSHYDLSSRVRKLNEDLTAAQAAIKTQGEIINPLVLDQILNRSKEYTDSAVGRITAQAPQKGDKGDKGKDGLNWIFEFDPRMRGLLRFRREDQTEWQFQDLKGPPGDIGGYHQDPMDRMTAAGTSILSGWGGSVADIPPRVITVITSGSRVFNVPFRLDQNKDAFVAYSINVLPTLTDVNTGGTFTAQLQTSTDGLRWTTVGEMSFNLGGSVLFGSSVLMSVTQQLSGWVQRNNFCQILVSGTNSGSASIVAGQEVLN